MVNMHGKYGNISGGKRVRQHRGIESTTERDYVAGGPFGLMFKRGKSFEQLLARETHASLN